MRPNVRERNRLEAAVYVVLAMTPVLFLRSDATTFLAIADGPCMDQPDLARSVWPAWVDPNQVGGHLIDIQTVRAGKYNRVGTMCDPCDYPIDVELVSAPAGMTVSVDRDAETWTIAGELEPGDWAIVARGTNRPLYGEPNEVIVTVYVRAIPPVIQKPRLY